MQLLMPFKRFHLVGQSGGGHTVAALAQTRNDIGCAVIASGSTSIKTWYRDRGRRIGPAPLSLYNPIEHVSKLRNRPGLRLIAISDPNDKVVPIHSQREFVERVRSTGVAILHVAAEAKDKLSH